MSDAASPARLWDTSGSPNHQFCTQRHVGRKTDNKKNEQRRTRCELWQVCVCVYDFFFYIKFSARFFSPLFFCSPV